MLGKPYWFKPLNAGTEVCMGLTMIRNIGHYRLTAHTAPAGALYAPEILVSFEDGITLRGYKPPDVRFETQLAARHYARQWMGRCKLSALGILEDS
ncbi:hypothetical protein [Xanthomonas hortorum]|uniref:hypothetical protein n=1 Tax=Xanthomonas hortorum TaxID=56454 RepID=UPI0020CEDB70|nr:hypothetical protein [Xanthomonas hortorum]